MLLIQAQTASVAWDTHKKRWTVTIKVGGEVIRRTVEKPVPSDSSDDVLSSLAVDTAKDEGYDLKPESVRIER